MSVQALRLAYALAVACAPEGTTVETSATASAASTLPLVVVQTSAPVSIPGPVGMTSRFSIALTCYAEDPEAALDLCMAMHDGFLALWRAGHTTAFGSLTSILPDSSQPYQVSSDLEADDVSRFDCTLRVLARDR